MNGFPILALPLDAKQSISCCSHLEKNYKLPLVRKYEVQRHNSTAVFTKITQSGIMPRWSLLTNVLSHLKHYEHNTHIALYETFIHSYTLPDGYLLRESKLEECSLYQLKRPLEGPENPPLPRLLLSPLQLPPSDPPLPRKELPLPLNPRPRDIT